MKTVNRQTTAIWAEHFGDAFVGCNGLLDELKNNEATEAEIGNIVEASNLIEEAINLLNAVAEGTVDENKE